MSRLIVCGRLQVESMPDEVETMDTGREYRSSNESESTGLRGRKTEVKLRLFEDGWSRFYLLGAWLSLGALCSRGSRVAITGSHVKLLRMSPLVFVPLALRGWTTATSGPFAGNQPVFVCTCLSSGDKRSQDSAVKFEA